MSFFSGSFFSDLLSNLDFGFPRLEVPFHSVKATGYRFLGEIFIDRSRSILVAIGKMIVSQVAKKSSLRNFLERLPHAIRIRLALLLINGRPLNKRATSTMHQPTLLSQPILYL